MHWPIWTSHISGLRQILALCVWIISLNVFEVHPHLACVSPSFFPRGIIFHFTEYHILLTHSSIQRHVGHVCQHCRNGHGTQVSAQVPVFSPLGCDLHVELLGPMALPCLTFSGTARLFPTAAALHAYTGVRVPVSPPALVCCMLWV